MVTYISSLPNEGNRYAFNIIVIILRDNSSKWLMNCSFHISL